MSDLEDLSFKPEQFSGRARLFPLPNLVLFPHVMQPLHIFEPRYRAMLEDAVADDKLLALAALAPGWEKDYEGRPPIDPVACLARIATWRRLDDGRYNILVLGLRRVAVVRELPPKQPFRVAEVAVLDDQYTTGAAGGRAGLQRRLVKAFRRVIPSLQEAQEQLERMLEADIDLGMLTDIISYALDLELRIKRQLLRECNVDRRAKLLVTHLANAATDSSPPQPKWPFPPEFSNN